MIISDIHNGWTERILTEMCGSLRYLKQQGIETNNPMDSHIC